GDRGENVKEQAPRRGGGVDLLIQNDQINAERRELASEADQVMGGACQAVELRHGDDIDLPRARCLDEPVKRGTALLRAAHAVVDELLSAPAPRFGMAPQSMELAIGRLLPRGDAAVQRGPPAMMDTARDAHRSSGGAGVPETGPWVFGRVSSARPRKSHCRR